MQSLVKRLPIGKVKLFIASRLLWNKNSKNSTFVKHPIQNVLRLVDLFIVLLLRSQILALFRTEDQNLSKWFWNITIQFI